MATKVLQINPQLFKTNGKNNTSKNREKKQKPEGYKGPSTLRKALLGKIRDFQKKEQENNKIEFQAKNNTQNVEEIKEFNNEFNKSLDFLQELSKRHNNSIKSKKEHKKENKIKNKTLKQALNGVRPNINLELPSDLLEPTKIPITTSITTSIPSINANPLTSVQIIPQQMPQIIPQQMPQIIPQQISQIIPQQISQIIPQQIPQIIPQIIPQQISQIISQQMPQPIANPITESNKDKIETNKDLLDKKELIINNIKEPPPYSNLKGGNKPSYKEWNRQTQKRGKPQMHPSITIEDKKNEQIEKTDRAKRLDELRKKYKQNHKNTVKQLVRVKTRTIKYNLGNNGKTVGILIKNRQTRKKIKDEHDLLKKKTLADVKDYLREKNLIKAGTMAPTDVLRTLYEQSILTGDVTNKSKDNLLHNFIST
jgi:hypothetical protein